MDIFDLLTEFFVHYSYWAVFFTLILCGLGLPLPEDIVLVAGGVVAGLYPETINVHWMFLVALTGVLLGDTIMYSLGRIFGQKALAFPLVARVVTPNRFAIIQEKFETDGSWVLFFARFMPGLRSPIFLIAGATNRVSYFRFLATDGLAALISVPVWVYLGEYGALNIDWLLGTVKRGQSGVLIVLASLVLILILAYFYKKMKRAITQSIQQKPSKMD